MSPPARRTIMVSTPIGPLELDFQRGARADQVTLGARGRLVPFWGALTTELHDIATVDLRGRRVISDRRRIRHALRVAHGPRVALKLIPILVPALERALAHEQALLAYAELRVSPPASAAATGPAPPVAAIVPRPEAELAERRTPVRRVPPPQPRPAPAPTAAAPTPAPEKANGVVPVATSPADVIRLAKRNGRASVPEARRAWLQRDQAAEASSS